MTKPDRAYDEFVRRIRQRLGDRPAWNHEGEQNRFDLRLAAEAARWALNNGETPHIRTETLRLLQAALAHLDTPR